MKRIILCIALLIGLMVALSAPASASKPTDDQTVQLGSTGQRVTEVQLILKSYGYVLPVDGKFTTKTQKAVMHFQKASGLVADGVVGPVTWDALNGPATATAPAVRANYNPAGLRGLPFAPEGLGGCAEAAWYAAQAGLPDTVNVAGGHGGFDDSPIKGQDGWTDFAEQAIPMREAGCDNTSSNSIAGGYFGFAWSNLNAPGYRPFTSGYCEAHTRDDVVGPTALQKQKQACVAMVLYSWWTTHPGSPWPWRL